MENVLRDRRVVGLQRSWPASLRRSHIYSARSAFSIVCLMVCPTHSLSIFTNFSALPASFLVVPRLPFHKHPDQAYPKYNSRYKDNIPLPLPKTTLIQRLKIDCLLFEFILPSGDLLRGRDASSELAYFGEGRGGEQSGE